VRLLLRKLCILANCGFKWSFQGPYVGAGSFRKIGTCGGAKGAWTLLPRWPCCSFHVPGELGIEIVLASEHEPGAADCRIQRVTCLYRRIDQFRCLRSSSRSVGRCISSASFSRKWCGRPILQAAQGLGLETPVMGLIHLPAEFKASNLGDHAIDCLLAAPCRSAGFSNSS